MAEYQELVRVTPGDIPIVLVMGQTTGAAPLPIEDDLCRGHGSVLGVPGDDGDDGVCQGVTNTARGRVPAG